MATKLFKRKILLGYKEGTGRVDKAPKDKLYYPSMYVRKTQLPLEGADVGKTFNAQVKLKLTGLDQSTNTKKTRFDYHFDIMEISFTENK